MEVKELEGDGLIPLLELYTFLPGNTLPEISPSLTALWEGVAADRNHHIVAVTVDGLLVSSCVLIIVPNLTHGQRPYGLIENVVTHPQYRGRGYATAALNYAKEIAVRQHCYKIMLMTGSKTESTLRFYERAGYNRQDKTAFIQWI